MLCSVFLVAIPAIAAEQNQEMQKVSTSTITTASEDNYVLGVYGNANEDDTIDMRDLTYVKLIFFGKKPETELADAKYDGKINPLDFIQIKLIIVGKEKVITIVDEADRIVTIDMPVERIVSARFGYAAEVMRALGAKDKIVGVGKYLASMEIYFPELSKLPNVGAGSSMDYEMILSLNPDLVITTQSKPTGHAEKLPGIPVVAFNFYTQKKMNEEVKKLGYILRKKDEAKYFTDSFHKKYTNLIKTRTEGLSEEERPRVYVERHHKAYKTYAGTCKDGTGYVQQVIDMAGGRNIFADITVSGSSIFDVDPEEVVKRNPDIIIKYISAYTKNAGYWMDDPSQAKATRDEIMSRPELANVNAVKNGRVYMINMGITAGPGYPIGNAYFGKWLQPELFEDLDTQAIHQEYLTEFQGLDFDVSKHGVFVYHPELYPDGR